MCGKLRAYCEIVVALVLVGGVVVWWLVDGVVVVGLAGGVVVWWLVEWWCGGWLMEWWW